MGAVLGVAGLLLSSFVQKKGHAGSSAVSPAGSRHQHSLFVRSAFGRCSSHPLLTALTLQRGQHHEQRWELLLECLWYWCWRLLQLLVLELMATASAAGSCRASRGFLAWTARPGPSHGGPRALSSPLSCRIQKKGHQLGWGRKDSNVPRPHSGFWLWDVLLRPMQMPTIRHGPLGPLHPQPSPRDLCHAPVVGCREAAGHGIAPSSFPCYKEAEDSERWEPQNTAPGLMASRAVPRLSGAGAHLLSLCSPGELWLFLPPI